MPFSRFKTALSHQHRSTDRRLRPRPPTVEHLEDRTQVPRTFSLPGIHAPLEVTRAGTGTFVVVLLVAESLTAKNAGVHATVMAGLVEPEARVVVDLCQVRSVDCYGCNALLAFRTQMNAVGGRVALCSICQPVRAIFQQIGIHKVLDIFNSRDEAFRAFHV